MKKFTAKFFAFFLIFSSPVLAQEAKQYPNITGQALMQVMADRVLSTKKQGVSPNNVLVYVQPDFAMNFDKNWSVRTQWRMYQNNTLTTRDQINSERYRTFLSNDRGLKLDDTGVIVEELKIHFENEDMRAFAGKFDPGFGTAHDKSKRIGIFTSQFTEDYNLREKIGAGITALLENSKFTANTFFNDTTGLSRSAINDRGRAARNDGEAGNTGTFSSYSVAMEGERFLGVENLYYNLGYRSLGVDKMENRRREKGYVFGTEYLYEVGLQSALIPFVELVKIDDFTGEQNRNAVYTTFALMGKYSSWSASVSHLTRTIKQPIRGNKISDRQFQITVGYKFTDNLTLDITRADIKEDGHKGELVGALLSYLYKF